MIYDSKLFGLDPKGINGLSEKVLVSHYQGQLLRWNEAA